MKVTENIRPITYLKTNSADLVGEVNESKKPIFITQNGEAKVVIQDLSMYQQQQDQLMMLKAIALGENEIKSNKTLKQSEVFTKLESKYKL